MGLLILIIVIAVFAFFVFVVSRFSGRGGDGGDGPRQKNWIQFYAKGKDSGFSFKEIELLRRLAIRANLADPQALFWSQNQLDICIRSLVKSTQLAGTNQEDGIQDFLSKLYDYRKKIEMEKPRVKRGIVSSREINESQGLRILLSGTGVFNSQVIKNTGQYMTITRPASANLPAGFTWIGQRISVYFWRNDDAGYVFDSTITDEVYSKGLAALQISHSQSLFRTQKRKSIRLKTNRSAFLYILGEGDNEDRVETTPGLKCILEDISDSGCAVVIGGKASPGMRVKVQFSLANSPLIMCGPVRSVDFKEEQNRSVLHIEAEGLSIETRNRILGEVFGMLSEEEEPLPFKVLDAEMENEEQGEEETETKSEEDPSIPHTDSM